MNTPALKIKKNKKFISKDEKGQSHEIEMGLTIDSVVLKSEIDNGVIASNYSNLYSFDKLKQNKIFAFQENIEEIYDQIEIYINDEQVTSKFNENNLIIKLLTRIKKLPEITFELKQEVMNDKEIIKILMNKISKLESNNKNL